MTPTRSRTETRARIEIIPLIDVIFFLLATFVLFTLSLNRIAGIEVKLPETTIIPAPPEMVKPVVVTVSAGGALHWEDTPISAADLPGRLALLRETTPDPRVLIAGDMHASYRAAVDVLDQVRLAGIDQVSIETRVRPTAR